MSRDGTPENKFVIAGTVVDAESAQPLEQAGVFFEGSDENAMLTSSRGRFRSAPLSPGEYRFIVKKQDYREGQCQGMISGAPSTTPVPVETVEVRCELTPAPRVATLTGEVRDASTTEFVGNASVVAQDVRGRDAAVTTDSDGRFRFETCPPESCVCRRRPPGTCRA